MVNYNEGGSNSDRKEVGENCTLFLPNGQTPVSDVSFSEDSTNDDEVNIDISFSPYGIVKRVDETITVDTN
jgi:hypothetical protein